MANTMTLIASSTVASSQNSITFSSIPATYTDLCLLYSARVDNSGNVQYDVGWTFNGSSYTYSSKRIQAVGSSASSASESTITSRVDSTGATASTFGNGQLYIPNYAGSNNKSLSIDEVAENNGTNAWLSMYAGLISTTSAISSITGTVITSNNFLANSTFYLYGIKNS
jgi:hypothetical protein